MNAWALTAKDLIPVEVLAGGLLFASAAQPSRRAEEGKGMTSLSSYLTALQIIATWLMSALAIVALMLSVIVSLAFVELVLERGGLARAYTAKFTPSDNDALPARTAKKI